jgi:hypothetical protein
MFLGLLLGSFLIGLLLGASTRIRFALLLAPPVAIALLYWVEVGWGGDAYDIGREGLLLVTGMIGAFFVALWAASAGIARRSCEAQPRSSLISECSGKRPSCCFEKMTSSSLSTSNWAFSPSSISASCPVSAFNSAARLAARAS